MTASKPSLKSPAAFPLCLIGFGNAGQAFCQILLEQHDRVLDTYGVDLYVSAISTRSKGTIFDPQGLDLNEVLRTVRAGGRLDHRQSTLMDSDPLSLIRKCGAKAMLELSTLSIEDGQPAISHIETAFESGMHVITANKGPLAWAYSRLKALADSMALELLHETTVMDGAPVFNLAKETLPGCKVLGFKGILNSTTNFVLERMAAGDTYEEALLEAKRQGFAEADPSLDIDGWDAAAKTSALINVLMEGSTTPLTIDRTGIAGITPDDIKAAQAQGGKLKLICEGHLESGEAKGSVKPVFVDSQDMFSTIDATTSILCLKTDLMGEVCMVERHPEIQQTAYGVFSDTLTLIRRLNASGRL